MSLARFLTLLSFSAIVSQLLMLEPVLAHPETGLLPDAVAETEYRIVLEINPKDLVTRNKLGLVLYRKNKLKDAEKVFAETLRMAPANFDAHDGMGLVRIKERKYEEAVSWFRKAITISGDDTMVYYNMGFALEQMGKLKDAEAAYKRSLQVNAALMRNAANRDVEAGRRAIVVSALTALTNRMKTAK